MSEFSEQADALTERLGKYNFNTFSLTFQCPILGFVSPKACEACRIRKRGSCPINKP